MLSTVNNFILMTNLASLTTPGWNKKKAKRKALIASNSNLISSDKKIVDLLNAFFQSVFTKDQRSSFKTQLQSNKTTIYEKSDSN